MKLLLSILTVLLFTNPSYSRGVQLFCGETIDSDFSYSTDGGYIYGEELEEWPSHIQTSRPLTTKDVLSNEIPADTKEHCLSWSFPKKCYIFIDNESVIYLTGEKNGSAILVEYNKGKRLTYNLSCGRIGL